MFSLGFVIAILDLNGRLCDRYLVDEPSITVIGKPSAALAEKLAKEAKEHLAATKEKLGEAGLKKKGEELDEAQKENDRPIPDEMITDFPISDVSLATLSGMMREQILNISNIGFKDRLDPCREVSAQKLRYIAGLLITVALTVLSILSPRSEMRLPRCRPVSTWMVMSYHTLCTTPMLR